MSEPVIPLCEPVLAGNESKYLAECVATNFVSSVGPFVDRFSREFAEFVGAEHAVPCGTGTAAIHVALHLLDLAPGDEVFVSSLTFIASVNPIAYERATPVLVDCERDTFNMDIGIVIEELERRARTGQKMPRAILPVHLLGEPLELGDLLPVAARHGIPIIEDAAEALGATMSVNGAARHVGTFGLLGCFSFNGNKVITTGGGGMITTDDERLAKRARHLTTQARLPGDEYRHDEVGFNYRLTNVAAALGVAQLEQLPTFLEKKRAIAATYDAALSSLPGVSRPRSTPGASASSWLYSVRIDRDVFGADRKSVAAALGEIGITCRPIWTPVHLLPPYRDAPRLGGSRAEAVFAEGLSLPSSVSLSPTQQERVIAGLRAAGRP